SPAFSRPRSPSAPQGSSRRARPARVDRRQLLAQRRTARRSAPARKPHGRIPCSVSILRSCLLPWGESRRSSALVVKGLAAETAARVRRRHRGQVRTLVYLRPLPSGVEDLFGRALPAPERPLHQAVPLAGGVFTGEEQRADRPHQVVVAKWRGEGAG